MEKAGTGIKRVTDACKDNGNKVDFNFTDSFWVTFESNDPDSDPDNVPDNVPENRLMIILKIIEINSKITLQEMADHFNVSKRTIRRDVEKLKNENKLRRIGSEKGGHWEVVKGD